MGRFEAEKVEVELRLPTALSVIVRVSLAERESDDCALMEDLSENVALMDRCVFVDCVEADGGSDSVAACDGEELKHVVAVRDSATEIVADEIAEDDGCEADADRLENADLDGAFDSSDESDGTAVELKHREDVRVATGETESDAAAVALPEEDAVEGIDAVNCRESEARRENVASFVEDGSADAVASK